MNGPQGAMPTCLPSCKRILREQIIILDLPFVHSILIALIHGLPAFWRSCGHDIVVSQYVHGTARVHQACTHPNHFTADLMHVYLNVALFHTALQPQIPTCH